MLPKLVRAAAQLQSGGRPLLVCLPPPRAAAGRADGCRGPVSRGHIVSARPTAADLGCRAVPWRAAVATIFRHREGGGHGCAHSGPGAGGDFSRRTRSGWGVPPRAPKSKPTPAAASMPPVTSSDLTMRRSSEVRAFRKSLSSAASRSGCAASSLLMMVSNAAEIMRRELVGASAALAASNHSHSGCVVGVPAIQPPSDENRACAVTVLFPLPNTVSPLLDRQDNDDGVCRTA